MYLVILGILLYQVNKLPINRNQKAYINNKLNTCTLILGVFAVSYITHSNTSYKSVNLEPSAEEMTKSTVKDDEYGISFSDDENNSGLRNNQPESKLVVENYKEKIISLLNNEFVQVYIFLNNNLVFIINHSE